MTLYGRFVPKSMDMGVGVVCEPEAGYRANEEMEPLSVEVESYSKPTVTMAPLPAGMRFDANTLTVSGKPTAAGSETTAKITVKNASNTAGAATNVILKVLDAESERLPDLLYNVGYTFIPGEAVDITNVLGESTMAEIGTNRAWTVTGLPTGMSWNAARRTIVGSPTAELKSSTVTFKAGTDMATVTFRTTAFPVTALEPWFDDLGTGAEIATNGWRLTGGRACAAGTALQLSATAPAKKPGASDQWVFAGWYDAETNALENGTQDWRLAAGYRYASRTNDVTVYGRFVPKSEDETICLDCKLEKSYPCDVELSPINLVVDSLSQVKSVTWTAFPTGLKLAGPSAANGWMATISGTPTVPGYYEAQLEVVNQSTTATGALEIRIANIREDAGELDELLGGEGFLDSYGPEGLTPGIPVDGDDTFAALAKAGWIVSGLPGTMSFDPETGLLSGAPAKPGKFTVWFKKGTGTAQKQATTTFEVGPYPELVLEPLVFDEFDEVIENPPAGFILTGDGSYAANSEALLSAVAPEGYVFIGWADAESEFVYQENADYRMATKFPYLMPEREKVKLYGVFAPNKTDYLTVTDIGTRPLQFYVNQSIGGEFGSDAAAIRNAIDSRSMPVITATGLPPGVMIDPKSLLVTGKPTRTGSYEVQLKIVNGSGFEFTAWAFMEITGPDHWPGNTGYPVSMTGANAWNMGVNDFAFRGLYVGKYFPEGSLKIGQSKSGDNYFWGTKSFSGTLPSGLSIKKEMEDGVTVFYLVGQAKAVGKYKVQANGVDYDGESGTTTISYYLRDSPAYWLEIQCVGDGIGNVEGGNRVAKPGTTQSICASAGEGSAFCGWFQDEECTIPVALRGQDFNPEQAGSQQFVVPDGARDGKIVIWYACFEKTN